MITVVGGIALIPILVVLVLVWLIIGLMWVPSIPISIAILYLGYRWVRTTLRIAIREANAVEPVKYPATHPPVERVRMPKHPAASALDEPHWVDSDPYYG